MSDKTKNMAEVIKGLTASLGSELVGVEKVGTRSALTLVMSDGRRLPYVAGGNDAAADKAAADKAAADKAAADKAAADKAAADKVTFDDKQQTKIQELIDTAVGRTAGKLNAEIAMLKAENEKLKAAGDKGKGGDDQNKELKEALDKVRTDLQTEKDARAKDRLESLQKTKTAEVLRSIGKHNTVEDIDSIARLMDADIAVDEAGKIFIKGSGGSPKLNLATGQDMTLDEFTTQWLQQRPHFLRSSGPGSGSQGAGFTGGKEGDKVMKRSEFTKMNPKDQMDYMTKQGGTVVD